MHWERILWTENISTRTTKVMIFITYPPEQRRTKRIYCFAITCNSILPSLKVINFLSKKLDETAKRNEREVAIIHILYLQYVQKQVITYQIYHDPACFNQAELQELHGKEISGYQSRHTECLGSSRQFFRSTAAEIARDSGGNKTWPKDRS